MSTEPQLVGLFETPVIIDEIPGADALNVQLAAINCERRGAGPALPWITDCDRHERGLALGEPRLLNTIFDKDA